MTENTDQHTAHGHPVQPLDWEMLRSRYVLAGHVQQRRVVDALQTGSWNLDLATGRATFDDIDTRIGLLGNESHSSGTWRWGWALVDQGGFAPGIEAVSTAAKALPGAGDVSILHSVDVDLADVEPWELAMVAAGAAGGDPIYRGPHSNGAIYFTLRDVRLPALGVGDLLATLQQVLMEVRIDDHQTAIAAMLTQQQYTRHRESDAGPSTWTSPDRTVTFRCEYDHLNRLTGLAVRRNS